MQLLWQNMAALIKNFWAAGYSTVVAGSSFDDYKGYIQLRQRLPEDVSVYLVHLCASKAVRDQRRIDRTKPSTKASRDQMDRICPEDTTLQDNQQGYHYIKIQNDDLSVDQAVEAIKTAIPEIYAGT